MESVVLYTRHITYLQNNVYTIIINTTANMHCLTVVRLNVKN